jgi:hypothetical protein
MENKTNRLLEELYQSKWDALSEALVSFNEEDPGDDENRATHPLLLQISDEYENADLKVMFFGQETNDWCGVFEEDDDISPILKTYQDFYLNKGYESYGKPFWNYIKKLKNNNTADNSKKIGYVWNNLLKIGKCESGTPQNGLLNETLKYFNVIPQEIELLKPDILLFFTGPNYDQYISERIGEFSVESIEGFDNRAFCKLNFKHLPVKLALRTYHPAYLQRTKRNDIFNAIINILNTINYK